MKETQQGLINYLETVADRVVMHPKATAVIRQAASIIRGITPEEFRRIEATAEEAKQDG